MPRKCLVCLVVDEEGSQSVRTNYEAARSQGVVVLVNPLKLDDRRRVVAGRHPPQSIESLGSLS
jgi:hypothetical protein